MIFLIVALVLVGSLGVLNLLFSFAVLRRLREHSAELGRLAAQPSGQRYDVRSLVGTAAPALAAASGDRLVAFLDADCEGCHDHAPEFTELARGHDRVLAVVNGEGPKAEELLALVGTGIPVVRGAEAKTLIGAVALRTFPTFLLVEADGTIARAANEPGELALSAPVA